MTDLPTPLSDIDPPPDVADRVELGSDIFMPGRNIGRRSWERLMQQKLIEPIVHTALDGSDPRAVESFYIRTGIAPERRAKAIRRIAIRLAFQIYRSPDVMLSGRSALLLEPVDNILQLSMTGSRRANRIIGNAFVTRCTQITNASAAFMPLEEHRMDDFGVLSFRRMPDEAILLLELSLERAPRKREGRISKIELPTEERIRLLERLVLAHGSFKNAWQSIQRTATALRASSSALTRLREFVRPLLYSTTTTYPTARFDVRSQAGFRIGQLQCLGPRVGSNDWRWQTEMNFALLSFIRSPSPSGRFKLPVYFECLLPERLGIADDADRSRLYLLFGKQQRCMSGIQIHSAHHLDLNDLGIVDRLETRLSQHVDAQNVFTGSLSFGFGEGDLVRQLITESQGDRHPAIAGMQDKVGCYLAPQSALLSATGRPFTHILKLGLVDHMQPVPTGEWFCARLLSAVGVATASHALVDLGDGAYPAFLSERFDIPTACSAAEPVIAFEDFCSLLERPIHLKYQGSMEEIGQRLLALSSNPSADAEQLFAQTLCSFLVGNMDAHLRNFGMLTYAERADLKESMAPVAAAHSLHHRLAPAFDVVCTLGLPFVSPTPSLSIARNRVYSKEGLIGFASGLGIDTRRAEAVMQAIYEGMTQEAERLLSTLPEFVKQRPRCVEHLQGIQRNILNTGLHLGLRPADDQPNPSYSRRSSACP